MPDRYGRSRGRGTPQSLNPQSSLDPHFGCRDGNGAILIRNRKFQCANVPEEPHNKCPRSISWWPVNHCGRAAERSRRKIPINREFTPLRNTATGSPNLLNRSAVRRIPRTQHKLPGVRFLCGSID